MNQPEPSQEELYEILYKFSNYWREGWQSMEQRLSPDEALSAINSLTLKQVLEARISELERLYKDCSGNWATSERRISERLYELNKESKDA